MKRRSFMRLMAGAAALPAFDAQAFADTLAQNALRVAGRSPVEVARDEDFWFPIQQAYSASPNLTNLNNGGVSPQPIVVQDTVDRYNRMANEAPSYYMWRTLDEGREPLREKLADLAGCSADELAIVRNTTEALDVIILGLPLKAGDEVILTKQDYPNMINVWKMREKRDGIVLKWLDLKLPMENEEELARHYIDAFTDRTRVVHITHIINWTGQIVPPRRITDEARRRGIYSVVDAAHTFAHLDYKIPDLGCDFFGTSLHKWLSAPFGTGMLYVKANRIKDLLPIFPNEKMDSDDIRKFEAQGTRNFPAEMAIGTAADFHTGIGGARKEARLRYLKNYWAEKAQAIPGVKLHTSLRDPFSCALCLFSIDGVKPGDVAAKLHEKFKIHVVSIEWADRISGVRVTPHVYTRLQNLDRLLEGIKYCSDNLTANAGKG